MLTAHHGLRLLMLTLGAAAIITAALATTSAAARPVNKAAPCSSTPVFVLNNGRFSAFDAPGTAPQDTRRINNRGGIAGGINDRGQVVGEYLAADGTFHGYLWQDGRFITLDKPGAVATNALDISDRG
jgi:probable HAF family extracellular repeat protein